MAWQYRLRWDTDPAFSSPDTIDGITVPSYEITGLEPETTYYVQVAVREAPDGPWSEWSDAESATTPASSVHYDLFFLVPTLGSSIHARRVEYRRGHHLLGLPTALVQQTTSYLRSLLVTGVDAHTYLHNRYYSRRYSVVGEALSPIRRGVSRFIALAGMGTAVARRTYSVIRTYVLPGRGRTRYERQAEYTRPVPVDGVGTTSYRRRLSFSRMVGIAGAGSLLVSRLSSRLRSVLTSGEGQSVYRRAYHGIRRRQVAGSFLTRMEIVTAAFLKYVVSARGHVHTLKGLNITYRLSALGTSVINYARSATYARYLNVEAPAWAQVKRNLTTSMNTLGAGFTTLLRHSVRSVRVLGAGVMHYRTAQVLLRAFRVTAHGITSLSTTVVRVYTYLVGGSGLAQVRRNLRKGINTQGTYLTALWRHSRFSRRVRVRGQGSALLTIGLGLIRRFWVRGEAQTPFRTRVVLTLRVLAVAVGVPQAIKGIRRSAIVRGVSAVLRRVQLSRRPRYYTIIVREQIRWTTHTTMSRRWSTAQFIRRHWTSIKSTRRPYQDE